MAELLSQVAVPVGEHDDAGGIPGAVAAGRHRRDGVGRPGHTGERGLLRVPRDRGKDDVPGGVPQGQGGHGRRVLLACRGAGAAIGRCTSKGSGEQSLARRLYPRLEEDWLLIADRNFYNWQGLARRGGYGGGAAVAGQGRPAAARAGAAARRLLPVRPGQPADQGPGPAEAHRGRPGAGEDLDERQGPARPRHRVRDPRPRRRREGRADGPGHHHHRLPRRPRPPPSRGPPPKMGARDRERQLKTFLRGPGKVLR